MARPLQEMRRDQAHGLCDLARDRGISPNTLYRIERGRPMTRSTMRKVGAALDVQPRLVTVFRRVLDGEDQV
jgi:DNA-binding Xre family transcriptional regulator